MLRRWRTRLPRPGAEGRARGGGPVPRARRRPRPHRAHRARRRARSNAAVRAERGRARGGGRRASPQPPRPVSASRGGRSTSTPPGSRTPPRGSSSPPTSPAPAGRADQTKEEAMRPDPVGSYHDADGARHEVLVRQTRDGWQVLDRDTAAGRARVIDTLESPDDGRPQAEAIARDYLTNLERHAAVERGGSRARPYLSSGGRDADSHRRPPYRIAHAASATGCAAGSGSLTGACSPASSRPSDTGRCSSGCCTSTPPGWSSWPPAAGATAGFRSPPAGAAITSSPGGGAGEAGVARGAARARRAPRRAWGGGVRRPGRAVRAARGEAGGERDPVPVGRRRPARTAARAVGVPRRAPVPHADRERRVRRLPRVLPAGGAAPGHARGQRQPASWSSRSSARTCGSSTASASARTAGRASPTRRARTGRGSCAWPVR